MQKEKTLKFWDDFYLKEKESKSTSKEWIVQPTHDILESISSHLRIPVGSKRSDASAKDGDGNDIHTGTTTLAEEVNILEIGCGNSCFSLVLWEFLVAQCELQTKKRINVTSTDVSSICVADNLERDQDRINSMYTRTCSTASVDNGSFQYSVLNVLEPNDEMLGQHIGILDKGCLDTFLFRSEKRKGENYSPLLRSLLDNVHSWLMNDGIYLIFSPRSKIKAVRDYRGFSSVKRKKIQCNHEQKGDLDGNAKENEIVYMYACTKCNSYEIGDEPFRNTLEVPNDEDRCASCDLTFATFRGEEDVAEKGAKFWSRKWKGHKTHCKAT